MQFGDPSHWAIAAAAAAGVTAARQVLIATWPAYRDASDRSNQQVVTLNRLCGMHDLQWPSDLPGVTRAIGRCRPTKYYHQLNCGLRSLLITTPLDRAVIRADIPANALSIQ